MGTNYYLHQKPDCECCGRAFEPLHIGKSSGGWCFTLHVIPEDGISGLEDWINRWQQPGAFVRDEYGDRVQLDQLLKIITERERETNWDDPKWWQQYYRSEAEYHDRNQSERGPQGLLRHRLGDHCKAQGSGTWDCIVGEFS